MNKKLKIKVGASYYDHSLISTVVVNDSLRNWNNLMPLEEEVSQKIAELMAIKFFLETKNTQAPLTEKVKEIKERLKITIFEIHEK